MKLHLFSKYLITLKILSAGLYPHIALLKNNDLELNSVTLLNPFYINRERYGSQVNVALVNCIGQLAKVSLRNFKATK